MTKTHLIIQHIGWSRSVGTNWVYNYYNVTIVSDDMELLKLQGVYESTFGSVSNYFYDLRKNKDIGLIIDNNLSETKQSRRAISKLVVGYDLSAIANHLKN